MFFAFCLLTYFELLASEETRLLDDCRNADSTATSTDCFATQHCYNNYNEIKNCGFNILFNYNFFVDDGKTFKSKFIF